MRTSFVQLACLMSLAPFLGGTAGAVDIRGYPLEPCKKPAQIECRAQLVADSAPNEALTSRDARYFPQRILELWNKNVRDAECARLATETGEAIDACKARLAAVSDYFNPGDKPPDAYDIGVALEGGGSKTAPFALGVLAGLQEAKLLEESPSRVRAISSVSGGSYAASYLFNRIFDRHGENKKLSPGTSDYPTWFASCVPSLYTKSYRPLDDLWKSDGTALPECGECDAAGCTAAFNPKYAYMEQVWSNPDLLFPDSSGLARVGPFQVREVLSTGVLLAPTLATVPLHFLGRTLFRFPFNVAPTKWAYRYGLERQYGFSPTDWQQAILTPDELFEQVEQRNLARTLDLLGEIVTKANAPTWIINSSSPGGINAMDWFLVRPRDPLRLQFELTPWGYGSGIYGYAKQPPESPMRLDTLDRSKPMSMGDATLASAAFFDSAQVALNDWTRLPAAAVQHGLNLEWFSEVRNFNASSKARMRQQARPWPFWGLSQDDDRKTPYIHLHDGGNSENTGVLPLLRRGYRTIVYSHGTADRTARFAAICHVKNELELDGYYEMRSPDLDLVLQDLDIPRVARDKATGKVPLAFNNYLDELCTRDLVDSNSEQAVFGIPDGKGGSKLSRLVCKRLNVPATTCNDYFVLFPGIAEPSPEWPNDVDGDRAKALDDLFFRWPGRTLTFTVHLPCPSLQDPCEKQIISTIYAALPAMSLDALSRQTSGTKNPVTSWPDFCSLTAEERRDINVNACRGPGGDFYLRREYAGKDSPGDMPCTSLGHVILNGCAFAWRSEDERPHFPQHDFVHLTWNSSYTLFAAYFDLGRDWAWRIRNTLCAKDPQYGC